MEIFFLVIDPQKKIEYIGHDEARNCTDERGVMRSCGIVSHLLLLYIVIIETVDIYICIMYIYIYIRDETKI